MKNLLEKIFDFYFNIILKTFILFFCILNYLKVGVMWHERPNKH